MFVWKRLLHKKKKQPIASLFKLVPDVIICIVDAMDKNTLIAFSATCKAARQYALPRLFTEITLHRCPEDAIQCIQTILNLPEDLKAKVKRLTVKAVAFRLPYLAWRRKRLERTFPGQIRSLPGHYLVDFVHGLSNLTHLRIDKCSPVFRKIHILAHEVVSLPRLTSIDLREVDSEASGLFYGLKNLKSIRLSSTGGQWRRIYPGTLGLVITNSQSTLEYLHLTDFRIRHDIWKLSLTEFRVWPKLRRLRLESCLLTQFELVLEALAHSTPNLEELLLHVPEFWRHSMQLSRSLWTKLKSIHFQAESTPAPHFYAFPPDWTISTHNSFSTSDTQGDLRQVELVGLIVNISFQESTGHNLRWLAYTFDFVPFVKFIGFIAVINQAWRNFRRTLPPMPFFHHFTALKMVKGSDDFEPQNIPSTMNEAFIDYSYFAARLGERAIELGIETKADCDEDELEASKCLW